MAILTDGIRTRQTFLEEYESTLGDSLGATAEESFLRSPGVSIMTGLELGALEDPRPGRGSGAVPLPTPIIQAEDARKRIAEAGVDLTVPDDGIREGALNLLIERKQADRRRQDILSRAPTGFVPGSLRIGTALATSLLDPLNVASAFVPVVSQARYLKLLAQAGSGLGRAGVRVGVGAIEGAAGAALVEPFVFTAAMQEQADYDLTDSLLNVAFGTVLGGGLHVGVGVVGDLINPAQWRTARASPQAPLPRLLERASPEVRETALRVAVAQAAEGRAVNVGDLMEMFAPQSVNRVAELESRRARLEAQNIGGRFGREIEITNIALAGERQFQSVIDTIKTLKQNNIGGRFTQRIGELERQADELAATLIDRPEQLAAIEFQRRRETLRTARETAAESRISELQDGMTKRYQDISAAVARGDQPEADRLLREGQAEFDRLQEARQELQQSTLLGQIITETARRPARRTEVDRFTEAPARTPQEVAASMLDTAERQTTVEASPLADISAADDADIKIKEAPKTLDVETAEAELADAMQAAQDTARTLGDEEAVTRELAPFDELAATADSYGKAVQAAALCQLRRGA